MIPTPRKLAKDLTFIALIALVGACSSDSTSSSPTGSTAVTTSPTPAPTVTPAATPVPTPTPTPALTCGFSLSAATFEPQRVNCPVGSTTQTMRLVFDLNASNSLPITINRVSTSGARCQASGLSSCTWPDGPLSFSPSVVQPGNRAQIVATAQFGCGSSGSSFAGAQVFIDKLFVNTSCGPSQEVSVTNTFTIGN